MIKNRLRFITILFILLPLSSVVMANQTGSILVETDGGFSYAAPSGWKISEFPGLKFKIAFGKPIDGFSPNINVVDENYNSNLINYVIENEKNMKKIFQNYKHIGKKEFQTNSGLKGIKLVIEADQQGKSLRQTFYFFTRNDGKKLVVTCSVPLEQGEKYNHIFDSSMKTFLVSK